MTPDNDDELTAVQQMIESPEAAQNFLDDLEGIEETHDQADIPGIKPTWQISFDIHPEDLPKLREELREYANGGE